MGSASSPRVRTENSRLPPRSARRDLASDPGLPGPRRRPSTRMRRGEPGSSQIRMDILRSPPMMTEPTPACEGAFLETTFATSETSRLLTLRLRASSHMTASAFVSTLETIGSSASRGSGRAGGRSGPARRLRPGPRPGKRKSTVCATHAPGRRRRIGRLEVATPPRSACDLGFVTFDAGRGRPS